MSPSFDSVQPLASHAQSGFFTVELDLSNTFLEIAETNFKNGNTEAARRAMDKAQQGCDTLQRFLTSSRHAKHLSKDQFEKTSDAWQRLRERLTKLRTAQVAEIAGLLMRERIALAVVIILTIEYGEQPNSADIARLQSWAHPDDRNIPLEQLARTVLHQELYRRKTIARHRNG